MTRQSTSTTTRLLSIAGLSMTMLAMVTGCGRKDDGHETPAAGAESAAIGDTMHVVTMSAEQLQHGNVKWTSAESREGAGMIEAPGQLVPNEDRTAHLGAPLQARVMTVHVQAGARVARGQALVTLQSPEASTARAEYDKATASLAAKQAAAVYARSSRERAERLLAAKAAPRQDVERAQADDALARSELAQAHAEVTRAQTAVQALGGGNASGSVVVRSPLDGVVLSRDAVPGAVVTPGAPLVTVTDASSLWLDMSLPAASAMSLANGSRVRFGVAAFPSDTFDARVMSIGGALDAQSRALPVRAAVTSTRNRLRSAMFATVWVDAGARTTSVAVPTKAVMLLDGRPVVFVAAPLAGAGAGARMERREVTVSGDANGVTRVLTGVKAGDLVVVDGAFAVKATFSRGKMPAGG